MTTIKLKNGSGAPSAGNLVQGEPALDLTNKRLYTENSSGAVIEVGTNPGEDVTFADNRKAIFGAGSDLQIYHDGSNSYIQENGTGDLLVGATNFQLKSGDYGESMLTATDDGAVTLFYNNASKLATTNTGIDVTGTTVTDGLTVSAPSGDTPVSVVTTTAGSFLSISDGNTTSGRSPLVGAITDDMVFYTSAGSYNERMRIDSSGQVKVGTTGPTWDSTFGSFVTKGGFLSSQSTSYNYVGGQAYYDGAFKRLNANAAELYEQSFGNHIFYNAISGAAGSTITWNERMRIDASGNVLVGVTSAQDFTSTTTSGHTLYGGTANVALHSRSGANALAVQRTTNDGALVNFFKDTTAVGGIGTFVGYSYIGNSGTQSNGIIFTPTSIEPFNSSTVASNKDGAIDLGASNQRFKDLYLSGQWVSNGSNNTLRASFQVSGTQYGYINVATTGTLYSTSSDYRIKENVVALTNATERLKQLNPLRFSFIPDQTNTIVDGFLAHEVADVVPEAILGEKDATDDDGNPVYQGIDQSKLVPLLVATIQELEARIAALESNQGV